MSISVRARYWLPFSSHAVDTPFASNLLFHMAIDYSKSNIEILQATQTE